MNGNAPAAPEERKSTSSDWLLYYRKKSILGLHLFGAALAFLAPVDILSQFPAAKSLVDLVNSIVPLPANFAKRSIFPELLQFYGAVMLTSSPWWAWAWFRGPQHHIQIERMKARGQDRIFNQIGLAAFAISMPFVAYFYLFAVTPSDYHIAPFQSERWALALFGPIFYCWAPAGFLVITISCVDVLRQIWGGK